MTLAEKLAWLQANTNNLSIHVNEHRVYYEDIATYAKRQNVPPSQLDEILASGQVIVVQCYPDTPIGFYTYASADFERAVTAIYELVTAERTSSHLASTHQEPK